MISRGALSLLALLGLGRVAAFAEPTIPTATLLVENRASAAVTVFAVFPGDPAFCSENQTVQPGSNVSFNISGEEAFVLKPAGVDWGCDSPPSGLFFMYCNLTGPDSDCGVGFENSTGAIESSGFEVGEESDAIAGVELRPIVVPGEEQGSAAPVRCDKDGCQDGRDRLNVTLPEAFVLVIKGPSPSPLSFWRRGGNFLRWGGRGMGRCGGRRWGWR